VFLEMGLFVLLQQLGIPLLMRIRILVQLILELRFLIPLQLVLMVVITLLELPWE
jgi:hypothetical protein